MDSSHRSFFSNNDKFSRYFFKAYPLLLALHCGTLICRKSKICLSDLDLDIYPFKEELCRFYLTTLFSILNKNINMFSVVFIQQGKEIRKLTLQSSHRKGAECSIFNSIERVNFM